VAVPKPQANVYVDGLNLYRRALSGTPYKWLDLERMASLLLHDFEIQQIYLRALRTKPKIAIHLGDFRADVRYMPVHPWQYDESGRPVTARVRKTEEKVSDVNLATHLILDATRHSADVYVVVPNDSDLVEPIRIIVHELDQVE
jgi:hypothetical protein